ncbi:hypothetical protein ACQ3I4_12950 [Zafaria sp. Z1313]|uniref:hypothetical protein n=1 Tax=Zafaria sp. Z1313 TaxID=3423202 RepID=UPI003D303162
MTTDSGNPRHDRQDPWDTTLIKLRQATDNGHRTDLDDALEAFGTSRDELQAELEAHPLRDS